METSRMEPKEKAIELCKIFLTTADALRCVDEIIKACEYNHVESHNTDWWNKVKEYLHSL